jgi:uncharacterized protein YjbI with pentapeptide repeats
MPSDEDCKDDTDLSFNFNRFNLEDVDFSWSSIVKASFNNANLRFSKFYGADLGLSYFIASDFSYANLSNAKLTGSLLWRARLSNARVSGTVFNDASIDNTVFSDLDLSSSLGLDLMSFRGPSTVGIDTIYRSKGMISKLFLQGCGVPDGLIEYMDALVKAEEFGNKFCSCFISYSHTDEAFAQKVYADLKKSGVRVWLACEDMKIGEKIRDTVHSKICTFNKVFLILSKDSVESDWVEYEVEAAFEQEKERNEIVLFPIMIDNTVMTTKKAWAAKVRQRLIGDFTNPTKYDAAFARLLKDLRTLKAPPVLGS